MPQLLARLVAPVTVRVYFPRPRAGTDRTNGRSWSNQKPLHRGSRTCRPFAPNQSPFKEDRGFIDWLDGLRACICASTRRRWKMIKLVEPNTDDRELIGTRKQQHKW